MARWGSAAARPANLAENYMEAMLDWLTAGGTLTPDATAPSVLTAPLAPTLKLRALIATSTSGASQLVAPVLSKSIRCISLVIVASAAVNVKFQSHTTPTDLTGLFYLAANGGAVLPANPDGWFQANAGEQLDINLSGAVPVGGVLVYDTF